MKPAFKRKLYTWLLMVLAGVFVSCVIIFVNRLAGMQINPTGFALVAAGSIWFALEAEPLRADIKRKAEMKQKHVAKDNADKWDE